MNNTRLWYNHSCEKFYGRWLFFRNEVFLMNYSLERITAHERLPSTHANVGFCDFHRCFANLHFHILCIIKDRPLYNFDVYPQSWKSTLGVFLWLKLVSILNWRRLKSMQIATVVWLPSDINITLPSLIFKYGWVFMHDLVKDHCLVRLKLLGIFAWIW